MKKYKPKFNEGDKEIFIIPKQTQEFIDSLNKINTLRDAVFYTYDQFASGVLSVFKGVFSLKMGSIKVSREKQYVLLDLKQVVKIEVFFDDGWIIDFNLKSGGSATIVFD